MTKPAMPKMPDYFKQDLSHMTWTGLHEEVKAYGRACYLAGLEAARGAVPAKASRSRTEIDRFADQRFNACRDATLAALDQLTKDESHDAS